MGGHRVRGSLQCEISHQTESAVGLVSRVAPVQTAVRNCTRDEGRPFGSAIRSLIPSGYAIDRATVRQKKTGQPVKFELTEQTRQAVDDYLRGTSRKPAEFLFSGRGDAGRCITTRQYARLVSKWIAGIGLDANRFRYTLPATNEGDLDLPADREPPGGTAIARNGDILPTDT